MGTAKAATDVVVRYFAVALATGAITVNTISPGWTEDSVLNSLPDVFQTGLREGRLPGWARMSQRGKSAFCLGNVAEHYVTLFGRARCAQSDRPA